MDKIGVETLLTMENAAPWYNDWLFSLISDEISGDILEIGAGIGSFSEKLSKKGSLTVTDINRRYLYNIKEKYGSKIRIGYGDIEKNEYDFNNKKFDTIVCLNVMEHIKNDSKAVINMYYLLKKGGKLILLVPAHMCLFSNFDKKLGHFRRYKKGNVYRLLRDSGFTDIKTRYVNWVAAIGWFVFMKILKAKKMPDKTVGVFNMFGKIFLWPEKLIRPPFGLSVLAISSK